MANPQTAADRLRIWLDERALHYEETRPGVFRIPMPGTTRAISAAVDPKTGVAAMLMPLVTRVPEDRFDAALAALNTLNATAFMGAWVLNRKTGEVLYRASLPLSGMNDDSLWYAIRMVATQIGGRTEERLRAAVGLEPLEGQGPAGGELPYWALPDDEG